jgi:hypothetical protein
MINIEYVEMLAEFSPFIYGQPPELAWIFALMLALFISVFPRMEREFRVTITLGIIIIIILFFISRPTLAFFATYDQVEVGRALANSLINFMRIITVLLYWAPIIFGVYGIINRDRSFVFVAVLFFIGIILTADLYLLATETAHTKTESKIPLFTVFAIALFCYYEMSDSSITFYRLNDSTRRRERYSVHQEHLDRILQLYFVFFIIFSALSLVMTWFILDFNSILKSIGSEQVAASIELNSIYGMVISLVVMVFVLVMLGYIIRYDDKFKELYKRITAPIYRLLGIDRGEVYEPGKPLPPPPPTLPPAFPYSDSKGHSIVVNVEEGS